jgi:translation elongation factor EF-4
MVKLFERDPQPLRRRQLCAMAPLELTRCGSAGAGSLYVVQLMGMLNPEGVTDRLNRGFGMDVIGIFPSHAPSDLRVDPM